ncbi:sensor histidine kinase [Mucilaginibacter rubeus]|uniref:histidine kinase n=1 Tax=Mucilaginibacter rubeus TaxID=2027860 RepID=A0A5C1HSR3_9SPHI|nr:ATP-binding protein [Mucilaginibacter rubeus]QEM09037.1 hypothetical protein DEO27_003065 [Mucilaginibacter rubeus]
MQTTISAVSTQTIIISTILLLLFTASIIYFLFVYQQKRFLHNKELAEIREAFNQTLLQSKLEIQEQTLDHIAKELHANFSHLVSLININLAEILTFVPAEARENVSETKSLAKQLMAELKALSASLNTDHIMKIGFIGALENELKRINKTQKYHLVFSKSGNEYRLRPEHEIILYRLCQEVLNNIVKYANASSLIVLLDYTPELFTLSISDNGTGFDVASVEAGIPGKESTGLLNIRKRAKLIDAGIKVESEPGKGTKIIIQIAQTK